MGKTITVLGPGAIGTTIAGALQEAGRTPTLCGRTARPELDLRVDGMSIRIPGPVLTDPVHASPADLVFLAVKATQLDAAAPWLATLCHTGTVVCVLQNGIEQIALVSPHVPGCTVIPAVVWFPAETQPDGSVLLRGKARLTLPKNAGAVLVSEALRGTRCEVDCAADFNSVAWRKLLQNAAAGLMVLSGRRSGMFHRDDIAGLCMEYLRECLSVARAEGAALGDDVPEQILAGFQGNPTDMGTSILADRIAGRPLEWNIRNGVIARYGRRHGVPTPISDLIVPLLAAASDGPG
ncbi:oxidoreductase [Acidisoma sp. 7E03]